MYGRVEWYLFIYLSICLSVCLSVCLSFYLSVCLSIYLSIYYPSLSVYPSSYLYIVSSHLSICLYVSLSILSIYSIYLSVYLSTYLLVYPSVYVYLYYVTVERYYCDSFEMLFNNYWSEILLQKTLLNQRERICCLNLNWWKNLNLILTLSNSWDALPSLVNTEMFIINYGYRQTELSFKV